MYRFDITRVDPPDADFVVECSKGTYIRSLARDMGRVAGAETTALGCNWAFAPMVDIHQNWRNTVVATRSFGNTPEVVIERAKAFFDGISETRSACAIKHFPGDGVDERDQHVVTSWNTLGVDDWHASYGRVYRELIAYGVQSIMVGHIGAPELSRRYRPGIADAEIMPGTLAPELLQNLLRGELGFNGLILTDASPMVGLTSAMKRRDLVPATIAAGCDMFLFFRHADEDFRYMLEGYRNGVISEARLQEALERILGLKASLGLHTTPREALVPGPDALAVVGSAEHHAVAAAVADKTVTLVKDTEHNLPLRPETHRRIRLYGITGQADFTRTDLTGADATGATLDNALFDHSLLTGTVLGSARANRVRSVGVALGPAIGWLEEGLYATGIGFPTVARDKARIRTIVTAAHTDDLLDQALAAFDRVGHELGVISG